MNDLINYIQTKDISDIIQYIENPNNYFNITDNYYEIVKFVFKELEESKSSKYEKLFSYFYSILDDDFNLYIVLNYTNTHHTTFTQVYKHAFNMNLNNTFKFDGFSIKNILIWSIKMDVFKAYRSCIIFIKNKHKLNNIYEYFDEYQPPTFLNYIISHNYIKKYVKLVNLC